MHAITPQLQTANYVLFRHLKFVKECRILPIIYTEQAAAAGPLLKLAPWGSWSGDGRYHRTETATCTCLHILYVCQLLTDRQREEPDRPSAFGRCHAQTLRTGSASTDRAETRPRSDSAVGPGPTRKYIGVTAARRGGGDGGDRDEPGGGVARGLIVPSSVWGVWQEYDKQHMNIGRKFVALSRCFEC